MTPKEKAEELVGNFYNINYINYLDYTNNDAIQCALIAVDEIIKTLNEDIKDINVVGNVLLDLIDYWQQVKQEVKQEIDKL